MKEIPPRVGFSSKVYTFSLMMKWWFHWNFVAVISRSICRFFGANCVIIITFWNSSGPSEKWKIQSFVKTKKKCATMKFTGIQCFPLTWNIFWCKKVLFDSLNNFPVKYVVHLDSGFLCKQLNLNKGNRKWQRDANDIRDFLYLCAVEENTLVKRFGYSREKYFRNCCSPLHLHFTWYIFVYLSNVNDI